MEQRASKLFGVNITRIDTEAHGATLERCAGRQGLVVPPRSSLEIPVSRGFHTLVGRFAICDAVGAPPVEFRIELLERPTRVLLGSQAATPRLGPRNSYPFAVTFWSEHDSALLLHTLGAPSAVKTAWEELELSSVRLPPGATSLPSPGDGLVPDSASAHPGLQKRRKPIERNPAGAFWLPDWGWNASSTSSGPIELDRANGSAKAGDGPLLTLNGRVFGKGVGMHAPGRIVVDLDRPCHRFTAEVGVDDAVGDGGSVRFVVFGDANSLFESGVMTGKDDPKRVDVPLSGVHQLVLLAADGGDGSKGDWADWAEPQLFCDSP